MKIKTLLLLAGLAFFCTCRRSRPLLVPEISPPLVQKDILTWTGRLAGDLIFPCAGSIGWVDEAGKIIACDIKNKTAAAVLELPFPVTLPPFRQGNFLVLRDMASDRLMVCDLTGPKVIFESLNMHAEQVLGVDGDCLVYLDGKGLVVHLWEKPAGMHRLQELDKRYFNCHFSPERILILGQERLLVFWRKIEKFKSRPLPQPAASPFFCDGEHIYYGSTQRFLVKYAMAKGKLDWKLRLGQVLDRQPLAFAEALVVSPSDQNVLQLNRRGSLLWWQALRSTMKYDLQPMSENLAAVLLNRQVKFIDPKAQRVVAFASEGNPASQPLAFKHELFFLVHDGDAYRLQRVGNRYGIDILLEGGRAGWVGRSLHIVLQSCNLQRASLSCEIRDEAEQVVFGRSAIKAQRAALDWVPLRPGKFTIHAQASAENRSPVNEELVQVVDPQQLVFRFYLHF
jgi:hypothetical protein